MENKNVYAPPLSVWKVIEESASPEKHSVIRSLVGISKLEYAADLRIELETLIEIWNELNSEAIPARYRPQTHLGLPEPPKQRDMLITEIHLLLESLRDKESGGLGFIPTDCSEDVINYTNHIIDHRTPTPTTPVLRGTPNSALNDEQIVDVAKNIPILDNETPIEVLRSALQCECDALLDDIEYVRRCVEEGHCDFEEIQEPSLLDLKKERKKLENHLMKSIEINPTINPSTSRKHASSKKIIPMIKPSTPLPKHKVLPPVRPTSAVQYSTSSKEVLQIPDKVQLYETIPPSRSLLGDRSHTDPSGKVIKTSKKELTRRKSASILQMSSEYDSVQSRHLYREPSSCRIFCGTPDSGVSSRPLSELGMHEFYTPDDNAELVRNMSELHVKTKEGEHSNMSTTFVENNLYQDASCQNSIYNSKIVSPQPPVGPRPPIHGRRSMHSAKFHKIKASGHGDL